MTEWLIFTTSPKARESFELIRNFMIEVFRQEALAHVRAVFLVDTDSAADAADIAKQMGAHRTARELHNTHRTGGTEFIGLYVPDEGTIIVALIRGFHTYIELYYVTAHELGHAIMLTRVGSRELVRTLMEDLPELGVAYRHLAETPFKEAIDLLKTVTYEIAIEMPAHIIADNYFYELQKCMAPIYVLKIVGFRLINLPLDVKKKILEAHSDYKFKSEEERARIGQHVGHAIEAMKTAARKLAHGELSHLAQKVHEVFAASIKEWPADVMEREPKYRKFLKAVRIE